MIHQNCIEKYITYIHYTSCFGEENTINRYQTSIRLPVSSLASTHFEIVSIKLLPEQPLLRRCSQALVNFTMFSEKQNLKVEFTPDLH